MTETAIGGASAVEKEMGFKGLNAEAERIVAAARARAGLPATTAPTVARPAAVPTTRTYGGYSYSCASHQFQTPLFTLGAARFFGGSRQQCSWRPWALAFSLLGAQDLPQEGFDANEAARALGFVPRGAVPGLSIDWPDGGVPDLTRDDWQHIADTCAARVVGNVGVFCLGGHGRTGTALAVLACLGGATPEDECPVAWLRDRYCSEAVETSSQCRYIERMTGRKVTELGSHETGAVFEYYGDWNTGGMSQIIGKVENVKADVSAAAPAVITNAAGDVVWQEQKGPITPPAGSPSARGVRTNEGEGFWCEECADWINRGDPYCVGCKDYPYAEDVVTQLRDAAELGVATRSLFDGFNPDEEGMDE